MKKPDKKILIGGVAVVCVLLAACAAMQGKGALKVETAAATRGPVSDYYTEEGAIAFGGDYQVVAQAEGPVEQLFTEENKVIKKGDVLLLIDSTDYTYDKELAESELSGLEAQLEQTRINQVMTSSPQEYLDSAKQKLAESEADYQAAKSVYEADQALYASGDISKVQMETDKASYEAAVSVWQQAQGRYEESSRFLDSLKKEGIDQTTINSRFYNSEIDQLNAQIASKKTTVQQLEDRIEKCQVKADRDGIVTKFPAKEMSVVRSGDTVAVISGSGTAVAEADVLTNIAPYIKVGDPVEVVMQLRGKDETYNGTVSDIYDYAAKGTSSLGLDEYRVHVKVALEDGTVFEGREGYGVNLKFCLYESEDCLTIPSSAVFKSSGTYWVLKIDQGEAVKAPVEMVYQTGTRTVITSGLEEGEKVIDQVDSEGIYEGAKVKE